MEKQSQEEKTGVQFGPDMKFGVEIARDPQYFTVERVSALLKEIAKTDYTMDKVSDFFDNKGALSIGDARGIKDSMMNVEKDLNPNTTEDAVHSQWNDMKRD